MSRNELKEIIIRVIDRMGETEDESPIAACVFGDSTCDVTSRYAVGEEG